MPILAVRQIFTGTYHAFSSTKLHRAWDSDACRCNVSLISSVFTCLEMRHTRVLGVIKIMKAHNVAPACSGRNVGFSIRNMYLYKK